MSMVQAQAKNNWKDKHSEGHAAPSIELARIFDQSPPCAVEAEMAVLGSMMLSVDAYSDAVDVLGDRRKGAARFYQQSHAIIYDALVYLYDQQQTIDMVRLVQYLTDHNMLEKVGGVSYLKSLFEAVPSATNATYYARIVYEKSILRQLIDVSAGTLQACYAGGREASDLLDEAGQQLFDMGESGGGQFQETLTRLIEDTMTTLEERNGEAITGVPTGFHKLDDKLNGLHGGEMLVLAARPSMGKTAFMLNVAENIALQGKPVGVFSLEMGKEQLAQRLLSSNSGVDSQKLRKNQLTPDDFQRLQMAAGDLEQCPMHIDDTPGLNLTQLRTKARRMKQQHDIQAIFIDYLQLMTASGATNRQEEVSMLSRGVKALARELNVPIICLSQLNRGNEGREDKRPRMSDLRESGAIEQDADVIMMVHREDYYHKNDPAYVPNGEGEILVEKQRNGPTGPVHLRWNGNSTRFENLAYEYQVD